MSITCECVCLNDLQRPSFLKAFEFSGYFCWVFSAPGLACLFHAQTGAAILQAFLPQSVMAAPVHLPPRIPQDVAHMCSNDGLSFRMPVLTSLLFPAWKSHSLLIPFVSITFLPGRRMPVLVFFTSSRVLGVCTTL